ncbi:MAG: zinc ribbon domain-containing protein [Thermoplasmata archaeon]|nr:MAG: zinc ribbon domain-containing protein [Thermoplasmata archaeon]
MEFDRETLLTLVTIVFLVIIGLWIVRIMIKLRRGPKTKRRRREAKVLQAVSSDEDSDSIFNSIISTRRIADDLKRRGIETRRAEELIGEARLDYDTGNENAAKMKIEEAKDILLRAKRSWDKKTGFDIVPSKTSEHKESTYRPSVDLIAEDEKVASPEEVFPELKKAVEKKPDNYLPSKFTISLAERAIDSAAASGHDVSEARRLLLDAKACFDREDYDQAFKSALNCKRIAEQLLGVAKKLEEERGELISDLATLPIDSEELQTCSICLARKIPYISIETKSGIEATCKECYEKSMGTVLGVSSETEPERMEPMEGTDEKMEPEKPEMVTAEAETKAEVPAADEEKQLFCPNCGAKVKDVDVFCGKCGKPVLEELKCVGCGEKVEPGDMFCRKCGARLVT